MSNVASTIVVAAPFGIMPELISLEAYLAEVGVSIVDRDYCPVPKVLSDRRCCELWRIEGAVDNIARSRLTAIAENLHVDLNLQSSAVRLRDYRLAVFDMDSTLIDCEVIDLLADAAGIGDRVSMITERAMRGEIGFDQSFVERLGLLEGLSSAVLDDLIESLPFVEGARELMLSLRTQGIKTMIVSGGFDIFAAHVANTLKMDDYLANTLLVADSKLTGQALPPIINGERKRETLLKVASELGIGADQTIAVGDGANDLPMLQAAGLGVAFRAKPVVRQQTEHHLSFTGLDSVLYLLGSQSEAG